MKNYYEILEVAKDASPMDIKRAYFSKVKKNRPEDDPEAFKGLRLAYDTLMDVGARKEYDKRLDVPEKIADELFEVTSMMENHRYKDAIVLTKKLIEKYPDSPEFAYILGELYIETKSTGHAVKHMEQAANKYPANQKIQSLLATAYSARGWRNKASDQHLAAIAIDETSAEAWRAYIVSTTHEDQGLGGYAFKEAMEINDEMFVDNHYRLYLKGIDFILTNFFYRGGDPEAPFPPELPRYFSLYFKGLEQVNGVVDEEDYFALMVLTNKMLLHEESAEIAMNALPFLEASPYHKGDIAKASKSIQENLVIKEFHEDEQLSDLLKDLIESLDCDCEDPDCPSNGHELAMKGDLLENITKYEKEIRYLKETYPLVYQFDEKFFDDALIPSRVNSMIIKNNRQLTSYIKRNPDFLDDMMDDGDVWLPAMKPIVRQEPKVGRNDPCPCGSGKKYKKCCI